MLAIHPVGLTSGSRIPCPPRGVLGRAWPVLAAVVVGTGSAPERAAAQLQAPEVTDVRFEGNETFSSDSLASAIATRETECRSVLLKIVPPFFCPLGFGFALNRSLLRDRDLPRDRARLMLWYGQRGFLDVQVDTPTVMRSAGRAEVVFTVTEGQPVIADSIVYSGMDSLGIGSLLDDLPLREGSRLSTLALDATRDSIVSRLADRGYAYAGVYRNSLRPAEDPYNAVVTFDVVAGPRSTYGDITIDGLESLSVGTVLRTVQLTTGDLYRRSEIEEASTRLYGLDIVRSASVEPRIEVDTLSFEQDSVIDVAINIQEGDPYRVRAGGGLNTAECLNFEARWSSRNFVGGGRLLQLRGRVGNVLAADFREILCRQTGTGDYAQLTGLASVEFVQPWIFSTRNSLSASLFVERQSLPNVFIRRAFGGQLALSRSISPQTVLTGFYRPEVSRLVDADDVLFCTGLLVCDPSDIRRLEGANLLSPVGVSLARDRSDDLLDPHSGYRILLDVEHAAGWTFSDFRYDRVVLEGSRYEPVGSVVLAARVRGGWVGSGGFAGIGSEEGSADIVHPQKRFYTGGANSVRGFAQSGLGPRVLFGSPARLLSTAPGGGACEPTALADGSCVLAADATLPTRPIGGTRVFEANAEIRFPVGSLFESVIFGDVGQAWGRSQPVSVANLEVTPGFGVRIPSPVGPIRIDLAYRFRGVESLTVVTERIRPFEQGRDNEDDRIDIDTRTGTMSIDWVSTGELVPLGTPFAVGEDEGFQLHLSIGQAF